MPKDKPQPTSTSGSKDSSQYLIQELDNQPTLREKAKEGVQNV